MKQYQNERKILPITIHPPLMRVTPTIQNLPSTITLTSDIWKEYVDSDSIVTAEKLWNERTHYIISLWAELHSLQCSMIKSKNHTSLTQSITTCFSSLFTLMNTENERTRLWLNRTDSDQKHPSKVRAVCSGNILRYVSVVNHLNYVTPLVLAVLNGQQACPASWVVLGERNRRWARLRSQRWTGMRLNRRRELQRSWPSTTEAKKGKSLVAWLWWWWWRWSKYFTSVVFLTETQWTGLCPHEYLTCTDKFYSQM